MNLPNKLTIIRAFLVPIFVVFMLTPLAEGPGKYVAFALFVIASFTDFLDGYIARKYNLVTNFGKFMDPIVDKLLVCSALVCLVALNRPGKWFAWVAIVIIGREFIVSGLRLVAVDNGTVIAASMWGKSKTVCQMIMIGILILNLPYAFFDILALIFIWVSFVLTIISLVDYIIKNKDILKS